MAVDPLGSLCIAWPVLVRWGLIHVDVDLDSYMVVYALCGARV